MATPTLVKGARGSRSTIALKLLMASSGLVFIGFVLLHMYGNLHALPIPGFGGHDAFNAYAEHLRTIGEPMLPYSGLLWVIRLVLIAAIGAHVYSALTLWNRASNARSQSYAVKKNLGSSVSSRWMRWGGIALLLFLVWHLLNFTIGKINVTGGANDDAFNLVVDSFSTWWLTVIYLIAMVFLGMHLHHGTWSAMQTLGFTGSAAARRRAKLAGWVVAIVIAGGFCIVPLAVLTGLITK